MVTRIFALHHRAMSPVPAKYPAPSRSPMLAGTRMLILSVILCGLAAAVPRVASAAEVVPGKAIVFPGDHRFSLHHQGIERWYRVHVPRSSPVVLAFHGGGGNMDVQANDSYYGLLSQSERSGHVLVFPNGYSRLSSGKFATWNAGSCCGQAQKRNVDDVGFVRAVLADVSRRLPIDRDRVFATGMSNGAMFSYRLACEMADTFTAIAAVAGTDGTAENCHPSRPVSILHIHARDDDHVPWGGGVGRASLTRTEFASVPATVSKWVRLNGCQAAPYTVLKAPGATCEVHRGCRGGREVQLCVTASGGHSWPGGVQPRTREFGSSAISANQVIWAFFEAQK
jgi:polyhydroxybutyrate depolymerase